MNIETLPIKSIKVNPNNPRLIKDDRFKKLVKSIQDFPKMLEIRPIVVNDEMVILGGNMRYKACVEAGLTELPVIKASQLTEAEQKEFIIKDNVGFGEHDWDVLANEWNEQELADWGLELPVDFGGAPEAQEDDFDVSIEGIVTDIVKGDLFEIGAHRLLCGDCTDPDQVKVLMRGKMCDMIFIDPPYAVKYGKDQAELQKKSGGKFSKTRTFSKIAGDMLSTEECAEQIWKPSFKNLYDVAKDDCSFYMTMCQGGDQMMMMMMMSQKWQIKHEIIWVKNAPVFSMGRLDYDYKHEPILFGWKNKHNFYAKGEFQNSVWEIPKPHRSDLHPTMKPVKLVENAILNSSKEGDLIVDFFEGSGTTMVASHQLNRIHYGMECAPEYCQVIINRMKALDPSIVIKKNGVAL